ncbi:MAG: SPASM domain-containing protein [Deltaproteobacteria bacterium]|nr:SPASM domain-containing protein [Deltaproteobacteria bacterium]
MPELSAPIRVTWDLPADPARVRPLWRRLQDGRVLLVDANVAPEGSGALTELAGALAEEPGPRLSLTAPGTVAAAAVEALGTEARGREVSLLPPHSDEAVVRWTSAGAAVTPSVWSTPEGLSSLPKALIVASQHGLSAVSIMNPHAPAEPLKPGDRAAAAAAWRASGLEGRVVVRCHDLFLAEVLGLDPFSGYTGCQAAGYLAHVDSGGRLVACRTLPQVLGDLSTVALAELWNGRRLRRLRAVLEAAPAPCTACAVAASCCGGCRGLAADLGRDPGCSGSRERAPRAGDAGRAQ